MNSPPYLLPLATKESLWALSMSAQVGVTKIIADFATVDPYCWVVVKVVGGVVVPTITLTTPTPTTISALFPP